MKDFDFDRMRSKLVPDERLVASTIDEINQKKYERPSQNAVFVKCVACVLVLIIAVTAVPMVLKNADKTDLPEKITGREETSGEKPLPMSPKLSIYQLLSVATMVRVVEYTDDVRNGIFDCYGNMSDNGVLARVEVVFNVNGYSFEDMYLPQWLMEEGYYDYLVLSVRKMSIDSKTYYSSIVNGDGKIVGVAFDGGRVDMTNENFSNDPDRYFGELNNMVKKISEYPDSNEKKNICPDYYIENGLSAERVKDFLDDFYELYWFEKSTPQMRELQKKGKIIVR